MSSTNGNGNGSNLQRIVIGAGTLVIIVLTVVIAIFLTMQDFSSGTPTPTTIAGGSTPSPTFTSVVSPPATATATVTAAPVEPTNTDTPSAPPPTATETPIPPSPPTSTDTPLPPPTPTNTPLPPPTPTETPSRPTPTPTNTLIPALTPSSPTQTTTPIVPQIDSVSPRRVEENYEDPFVMTVIGRNFFTQGADFRAELRGPETVPLPLREITLSDTSFDVNVRTGLATGTYDIVVTNPGGRSAIRSSVFTVGPEPTPTVSSNAVITRFSPMSGQISSEIKLIIEGRNFTPNDTDFRIELQAEDGSPTIRLDLGDVRTSSAVEAIIPANRLELGKYRIIIFNNSNDVVISADEYTAF